MSSGERRICRQVDQHWTSRLRKKPPTPPPIPPTPTRHRPCRCRRRRRFHWCHSNSRCRSNRLVPDRTTTSRRRCHTNGFPRRDCRASRTTITTTTIGTIPTSTTTTTTIETKLCGSRLMKGSDLREGEQYTYAPVFLNERKDKRQNINWLVLFLSLRFMFFFFKKKRLVCCTIHFTL